MSVHQRGLKPKLRADQEPLTKVPRPPAHLDHYGVAEWKKIMPTLVARKIICAADLSLVATYCQMIGIVAQIQHERNQAGGIIDVKLFGVMNRAAQTARQIAANLGLDPVSRARMGTVAADDGGYESPLDA